MKAAETKDILSQNKHGFFKRSFSTGLTAKKALYLPLINLVSRL